MNKLIYLAIVLFVAGVVMVGYSGWNLVNFNQVCEEIDGEEVCNYEVAGGIEPNLVILAIGCVFLLGGGFFGMWAITPRRDAETNHGLKEFE